MRRLCLLSLLLLLLVIPAATAHGATGPCVIGAADSATCTVWEGKVAWVDDGDTLHVNVGRNRGASALHVRITGIQAMELSVHSVDPAQRVGECHALEATARLEELVKEAKGVVRLAAQDPASESRGRLRRSVAVKLGGKWRDVGRTLLAEGLVIWMPSSSEWAWNARYSTLAKQAAAAHLGIWNSAYCGVGPNEGQPIKVSVNWDADLSDADNPDGEFVRIKNLDPVNPLPLGGWWLRDSDLRQYTFPPEVVVAPGATLTVHVGEGVDAPNELYWGLRSGVFDNVHRSRESGDGAYLFDPEGDLRAWMTYPCRLTCTADPNGGALVLGAKPKGREYITVRNVGAAAVNLEDYRLTSFPHVYPFGVDTVLQPGETLRVNVMGDPARDRPLMKWWGNDGPILRNAGDAIRLSSFTNAVLACVAWGDRHC